MPVDQKQADAFLRDLLQKFDKERDSLDPMQRRLILKYREAQARAEKTIQEVEQMRSQIKQAEARVRSLELQAADSQGKAQGFLEFLISMKFEEESAASIPPPQNQENPPAGNGSAPAGKKKIRALKSEAQTPAQ